MMCCRQVGSGAVRASGTLSAGSGLARLVGLVVLAVGTTGAPVSAQARGGDGTPPQVPAVQFHLQLLDPLPGEPSMFARGANARGAIVGHAGDDPWDNVAQPLVLVDGQVQLLPSLAGSLDFALGVGRSGLVAGTSGGAPVAWLAGEPRFLAGPGLFSGAAHDANGSGRVCGSMFNDFSGQLFAVVWDDLDAEGLLLPVPPEYSGAQAFALNEAGQIGGALVGGGFGFVGARWDGLDVHPVVIGPLPGDVNSEVVALNARGDAAGRSTSPAGSVQAMLHRADTGSVQGLGWLDGSFSEARAVDDRRRVVGSSSAGRGEAHGFLWENGVLRDLNALVGEASAPFDYISNAVAFDRLGRIVVEVAVSTPSGAATRIGVLTPLQTTLPDR